MGKCLIFNCQGEITNGNVDKFGYLKISIKSVPELGSKLSGVILSSDPGAKMEIVGDSYFTNSNDENLGKTIQIPAQGRTYIHNSDCVLYVDKYNLTRLEFSSVVCPIDELRYSTNLAILNTKCSGDIANLKDMTGLTYLATANAPVSGDIANLKDMTGLIGIFLNNTQVSGDIANLKDMTGLTYLNLENTQVSGDISALSNMVNLSALNLSSTQVSGAVDNLAGLTKLESLSDLKGISLTGDMSKIPINVSFISQLARKITTNFTWTANGRQNAKLLAMEGPVPFDTTSMDNMLIDQATCTFEPVASMPWCGIIAVSGTRTSASDAAVATIQSKGVTIIGVTKVS